MGRDKEPELSRRDVMKVAAGTIAGVYAGKATASDAGVPKGSVADVGARVTGGFVGGKAVYELIKK